MLIAKEVLLAFTNLREYRHVRTILVITAELNVWVNTHVSTSKFLEPVNRIWMMTSWPGKSLNKNAPLWLQLSLTPAATGKLRGCFTNSQAEGVSESAYPCSTYAAVRPMGQFKCQRDKTSSYQGGGKQASFLSHIYYPAAVLMFPSN